jgi:hypothetical protein
MHANIIEMLARSSGTRKLMNNSNRGSTISNASSVSMNAIANMNNSIKEINLSSLIGKTLLPIEKMETYMIKDANMASIQKKELTDSMIQRIKLKPQTLHAGSFMNKLRKTNKYKLTKKKVYKVCLIDAQNYANFGSKSNAYAVIGIIDKTNGDFMNSLTPSEEEFVNTIYSFDETIPLNVIGNSGSNSSVAGLIPAAGNVLSGLLTGGRRRRSRKYGRKTKKNSRKTSRRRTTRKH